MDLPNQLALLLSSILSIGTLVGGWRHLTAPTNGRVTTGMAFLAAMVVATGWLATLGVRLVVSLAA
jgi:hypothetical protein